jgi:hypothetical protein
MLVKDATLEGIKTVIGDLNMRFGTSIYIPDRGRYGHTPMDTPQGARFALRVKSQDKFHRRSFSGRRLTALCYHGHYHVFKAILEKWPTAKISTKMARYDVDNFEAEADALGNMNVGSNRVWLDFADACDCRYESLYPFQVRIKKGARRPCYSRIRGIIGLTDNLRYQDQLIGKDCLYVIYPDKVRLDVHESRETLELEIPADHLEFLSEEGEK